MTCPECGAAPDQVHEMGCSWEQCPYCGEHAIDCDCTTELPPLDDRMPWSGSCFWVEACLEYGFFERQVDGVWVRCQADDPDAQPDLNRLRWECCWNRTEKRYERRQKIKH